MPTRAELARQIRIEAANLAAKNTATHVTNGDETRFEDGSGARTYIASFTKGLPHDKNTGIVLPGKPFETFVEGIDDPTPENFIKIPLGPEPTDGVLFSSGIAMVNGITTDSGNKNIIRAWESMGAGMTFDLEGPDAQAVTIPPAPRLDGDELVTEMMENYWMALLRDVPFTEFDTNPDVQAAVESLNKSPWLQVSRSEIKPEERKRLRVKNNAPLTTQTIFRGNSFGEAAGPYISQFLLVGTSGLRGLHGRDEGVIQYGGMSMSQKVRIAEAKRDFMTTWASYLDAQNGANLRGLENYTDVEGAIISANDKPASQNKDNFYRFMYTPRDLCTWVHYDALYQAYLNACIILLQLREVDFDEGIPFQKLDVDDHQQGFAVFGGPHILSLVTEVATRALKAARFQKFNVHRRCRPERTAALLERYEHDKENPLYSGARHLYESIDQDLFARVRSHNAAQNELSDSNGDQSAARSDDFSPTGSSKETLLLPMAFPEGSPMHPSYAAGHATVAGACVTVLKAFFDHKAKLPFTFVPEDNGRKLKDILQRGKELTVEGELNKLCSNISIGRDWSGVHWYTDYRESVELGEDIALGILKEQMLTYREKFSMTVPLFSGREERISN